MSLSLLNLLFFWTCFFSSLFLLFTRCPLFVDSWLNSPTVQLIDDYSQCFHLPALTSKAEFFPSSSWEIFASCHKQHWKETINEFHVQVRNSEQGSTTGNQWFGCSYSSIPDSGVWMPREGLLDLDDVHHVGFKLVPKYGFVTDGDWQSVYPLL